MRNFTFQLKGIFCIFAFLYFNAKLSAQVSVTATAGTATGTFATVNEAFTAINAGTHQGTIVITVTGSTTEPATPIPLLKSATPSAYTSIKIVPSGDAIINSAAAPVTNRGIIELAGADNVTIDGDDPLTAGAQNLTIQSAAVTTAGIACIRLSSNSITGTDGADNNKVRNCKLIGSRPTAVSTVINYGIQFANGIAASASTTGAYSSLNTLIENNVVTKCLYGVWANGTSATYLNTGTIIRNNLFGSATATDNIGGRAIYMQYTATTAGVGSALIEGNDIRVGDVSATGTGYGISIYGVALEAANAGCIIRKNNIHDVIQPSTSGWLAAGVGIISATSNADITIENNFIRDMIGSRYTLNAYTNYGIWVNSIITGLKIKHNTIALLQPSTTGTNVNYVSGCIGINVATASVAEILSNIFVNNNTGTQAYAIYTAGTGTVFATANVNNNSFNAPKAGFYNAISYTTLSDWKIATGKDASSVEALPDFVSTTDLHINAGTTPNQLESGGATIAVTGITTDFDGQARPGPVGSINGGGTTPDIGADEFDGTPLDLTAPSISYVKLVNTASTANLVLTGFATITDAKGVNVIAGTKPRMYYKKTSDADNNYNGNTSATTGWKYVEASNSTSPFDFTINYTLLSGGITPGDNIQYFVIAQDNNTTPNVGINSGAFASPPSSVALTGSAFPIAGTINNYFITKVYSGSINVGASETIQSLTNAGGLFEALNNNILGGNLTVNITSDLTSETGAIALNQIAEQGAGGYTVTIKPSTTAHTISGAGATNAALIKLNGADRIVFDGSINGGTDRSLTITNTSTLATTLVFWLTSASATNGANNNTFKNCNISGTAGTNTTIAGILSGSGVTLGEDAQVPHSNNTIFNNFFTQVQNGMYLRGNTTTLDSNWVIKGNVFGSTTAIEKMTYRGMLIGNAKNFVVDSNYVDGIQSSAASSAVMSGIQVAFNVSNASISNNRVTNIKQSTAAGYGAYGINIGAATTASNLTISNNFVSDITGYGSATVINNGIGIYIATGGGYNIYHNTVSLATDQTATTSITSALNIASGVVALNVKNNILSNTQTVGNRYALYSSIAASSNAAAFTSLNNNAYGSNGTNLAYFSAAVRADLAALQAIYPTANANSKQVQPTFVSATDLHLQNDPNNAPLDDAASPVAEVIKDIDGEVRSASTPDIGADELPPVSGLDIKISSLAAPIVKQGCYNTDSIQVVIGNNSTSTLNFATNPVTVTVSVTGAVTGSYNATINTGTLASAATLKVNILNPFNMTAIGTYNFDIAASLTGDVNTANNNLSGITRTKVALTAGTIAVSPLNYCITGGTPKLTATGMDGYSSLQWQNSTTSGSGFTNITGGTVNPFTVGSAITQTMYYQLAATCGTTTLTSSVESVTLNSPSVTGTTPNYTCGTGTVSLAATGSTGTTLNWYASPTGGSAIGTGSPFVTPSISTTTNYYVSAASAGASYVNVGLPNNIAALTYFITTNWGITFDCSVPSTIQSVAIYPQNAGSMTISVQSDMTGSATVFGTYVATFTTSDIGTKVIVPINIAIPTAGTGYKMIIKAYTGLTGVARETISTSPFPFGTGSPITLTSSEWGGTTTATYYFFYDWVVTTGCESPRTTVIATVNNAPGCVVPVTLTNFTGVRRNSVNVLNWNTVTELNNNGFELLRSADGINFSKIAYINSKSANGNSNATLKYEFVDEKAFSNSSYYRLKQVDKDGKSSLSGIVLLKGERATKLELVNIYPNPATEKVNISLVSPKADKITIIVTDIAGKIVIRNNINVVNGDNNLQLNVQHLAQGSYMIRAICADGCETAVKKFVKD